MGANLQTFESSVSLLTFSADVYPAFFIFYCVLILEQKLYTLVPTARKDCMSVLRGHKTIHKKGFLNLPVLVIASAFRNIINDTFHSQSEKGDFTSSEADQREQLGRFCSFDWVTETQRALVPVCLPGGETDDDVWESFWALKPAIVFPDILHLGVRAYTHVLIGLGMERTKYCRGFIALPVILMNNNLQIPATWHAFVLIFVCWMIPKIFCLWDYRRTLLCEAWNRV